MVNSVCPLCGEAVLPPLLKLHIQLEKSLIREMREANPEWFSDDGVCTKCIELYKQKHEKIREEAREIRSKTEAFGERFSDADGEDDSD